MIRLEVEKYCQNCPEFEPDVVKFQLGFDNDPTTTNDTRIMCEHREHCERIFSYFEDRYKKEGKHE